LAVLLLLFFEVTTPDSVFHQLGILSPAHRWINLNHAFKDSGVWSLVWAQFWSFCIVF
jgi:hypothetical protein